MSIPDNPFDRDRDSVSPSPSPRVGGGASTLAPAPQISPPARTVSPPARTTSPPILNVTTHQPYSPDYSNTDSPMPMTGTATPGGAASGGGLAPPPVGTRTPRRVQWNSDSHIVTISPAPQEPPQSPSNTIDDNNIDRVHAALERHRSRSSHQRARPQSTLSTASSGVSADEEDYDYRLDVDPEPPLHPVTSQGSQRFRDDDNALHQILDNGVNDAVPEYINFGETDGLPNVANIRQDNGQSEAAGLVRAHTGRWGGLRRRVRGAGAVTNAFGRRGSHAQAADPEKEHAARQSRAQDEFASRYPDNDDYPPQRSHAGAGPLPGGQGASVLSSLLALYNQQQGGDSATTSAATSRAGSDEDSDSSDDDDESPAVGRQTDRRSQEQQRQQNGNGFVFKGGRKGSNESSPSGGNTPIRTSTSLTQHPSRSAPSIVDRPLSPSNGFMDQMKQSMNKIKEKDRPKAARNGAGVFGALVQNTNNLSGFAAPVNAQLAPAANRPGYQLSRYSAPDVNETEAPKVWRPNSRHSSRPGSVHSSTAVSNNGDREMGGSPMKKALSTDDMVSLRERERERREREDSAETTVSTSHKSVNKFRPKTMTLDSMAKLPVSALKSGGTALMKGGNVVMNAERWVMSGGKTPLRTPDNEKGLPEYFPRPMTEDERRRREWEKEKKRRKKAKAARKKKEVFIIQHVAAVLQRQQFLMKLARALMMFGSPSHRLETQIQATARVLELNAQVVYLPGTMLIAFGDDATHTSETKFLKQATGLDLGKLLATHNLYWNVVHDKISVEDASHDLDILMTTPVYYSWWQTILIGGMCSVFITVVGFNGSFIDALMTMPLGWLLCTVQILSARNDMFSNVFEIAIATIISFIAAALASTRVFCYTALVSGGVVLILPGYIVLTGALELASRNITAGAVRIGYSVIYSLFLGFGISIGAEIYHTITGLTVFGASDYRCESTHNTGMWYQVTPSQYWYFLCCPGFAFFMSLRNQQPLFAKELPVMVFIACAGWVSNFFSARAFPNRSDLTSAIGSFVVGTLGHIYGRFSNGSSFPVTVVGILFQLPSGLSNGGIFSFASENQSGSGNAYSDGFQVAEQLVSVAIGLTVGLFVSAAVTHPFGGGRKRGSGIFSF